MPLLLALLRGDPPGHPTEQDWHLTLHLAAAESVLPWLTHLLLTAATPVPPSVAQALQNAHREAQIQSFFYTAALAGVLKAFAAADIPVLLLKGPSFAQRVYGSTALRTSRDLDLLVRPTHFAAAQALLHTLGFTPNYHPDDYHQSLRRNTTTVELHYNVDNPLTFDFHPESAWQNAQPTVFHGQPAWLFHPTDELLYLALHGVRHRYERLSHILDLALALQHLAPPAILRPEVQTLATILVLGTAMTAHLHPAPGVPHPSGAGVGRSAAESRASHQTQPTQDPHTAYLAEMLWQHLLTHPEAPTDWQTLQRFYLQLEPTPTRRFARRLRQLRVLATRITQPDRDFAARFGLRRSWQARLMRPLRLLLERKQVDS